MVLGGTAYDFTSLSYCNMPMWKSGEYSERFWTDKNDALNSFVVCS